MGRMEGKVAIVTGAARGIGAAVAKQLASEGARVGVFDLNVEGAKEVVAEIQSMGSDGLALSCDVSKADQVETCFRQVVDSFGRLDIVVNNAGVIRDNLLYKMTEDDWDTVIDIHLKGTFLCSREGQKYMVPQRSGKIVNVSSTSALGNRGQTNYSAAKAGIQGMTRTMAIELGPFGINVNAVAPGFIATEMTRATAARIGISFEQLTEEFVKSNPIRRVGTPEDIAKAVAFLASDDAAYITGQTLYVAGRPTV
ncbi:MULTISPECIES: SDR family NAD(P)-dependent oxidoreductase [Kyrpidia]|uniref:Short-chain reductase protein NovJ n=2 Tax=Kyrpidia spormannii TaxID=2055160 RepID=A0A6F9E1V6_9BACL|nr:MULTISPECIES: beta-ketoacyl-ACP reductase [Kyrpidia]MCL6577024.1 beta-ketoacyl-ACP reductase [Kyrpidia sp.]CAB3390289.1 Short-chain reductase protein NovJ [Kyrpidia spormannii]CAB3391214.1 Short-chain reductase protein NovJ [Kyrpidia spormannii]